MGRADYNALPWLSYPHSISIVNMGVISSYTGRCTSVPACRSSRDILYHHFVKAPSMASLNSFLCLVGAENKNTLGTASSLPRFKTLLK